MNFLNLKKKIALGNNIFASKHFQNVVATRSPRVLKKKNKGIKSTKEQREGNIQNNKIKGVVLTGF